MSFIGGIIVLLFALIVGGCREAHYKIYGKYPKGCYIPREELFASGYYEDDDMSGYDEYYEGLFNDARSGDISAVQELLEEFGGEWEGEY